MGEIIVRHQGKAVKTIEFPDTPVGEQHLDKAIQDVERHAADANGNAGSTPRRFNDPEVRRHRQEMIQRLNYRDEDDETEHADNETDHEETGA